MILVIHLHVGQTVNVDKTISKQFAHVFLDLLVHHRLAVQNV